ncbi:hypothetical protein BN1708_006001 [Verticillium longisporum]|uniref:Zn(2)-C6 fungal-type domain-containing protein n=1 Tax=Verticillium longisporum TaxID=100787 RepID=A0A0G4MFS8_VERLO|nr:putative transcriptional regulatory protein C25B8.11 like [Verticillium longisporum]CRK33057.1 hypothetical protein BN1708_006001 [Verticillium longisporum]
MIPGQSMSAQAGQRRRFTIQSDFGSARQSRSRKSRPCDACRKRKTACVIRSAPPCVFCKTRGLDCQSSGAAPRTNTPTPVSPGATSELPERVPTLSPEAAVSHNLQLPAHTHSSPSVDAPAGAVRPDASASSPGVLPIFSTPSSVPSIGVPPLIRTLEDNPGQTSHSMGLAAEQDANLLGSFRSVIMNGLEIDAEFVQVCPGSQETGKPPVHFYLVVNEFFPHDDKVKEECSDAIEELVAPHSDGLVRTYFKHVHPVLPVVSKGRFLRRYVENRRQMPASLRGAIYALACVFWDQESSLAGPCPFEQHAVADIALTSLQRELDSPNLDKLQASLLLLHLKPCDVDSVEHPRTWTKTAETVACAQMIGLHQDAELWNIPIWEKKLRKKMWWATFAADVWSSLGHGNPPHIYPGSYSTSQLTIDDMSFDEDVPADLQQFVDTASSSKQRFTAVRFLEHVKLAQILREALGTGFQVPQSTTTDESFMSARRTLIDMKADLSHWQDMLPRCLLMPTHPSDMACHNAALHLGDYATQALLFRGLMAPATRAARSEPASNLRKWFPVALGEFAGFPAYMARINLQDLNGFWGRHARSQLILCGNFLIYLFLLAADKEDVRAAYSLIDSFHGSLSRLESLAGPAAMLLIGPVALRMNSFFAQAPDLMRGFRRWKG